MANPPAKPRLADGLREMGEVAIAGMVQRPCAPRVLIERTNDGWRFACPYDSRDQEAWEGLLFQAFGTRSGAVMTHFLNSLQALVGDGWWDAKRNLWMPDQDQFDAMLAIIASLQPENEAQAAHAAQLCALHLSAMKLGKQASRSYADPRTIAILNKTVRAYGDGMERLARVQGKVQPRQVNQTIQVIYNDQRDQRTQYAGGVSPNGGQPHRTTGGEAIPRPALPSPNQSGSTVPIASGRGQAGVQISRWSAWLWRAIRRA